MQVALDRRSSGKTKAERVGGAREVNVAAADGRHLAAHVFETEEKPLGVVVIAPAMGVPRQYYAAFARYLAAGGLAVVVADYRGVGDSKLGGPLRDERATLRDWGELDVPAVIASARGRFPEAPLLYVGHSVGGQLFGLEVHDDVRAALFVGSQSGYWRHWSGASRVGMLAMWYLLIPTFTQSLGYLPMSAFKAGEDLPRDVARDWARWGRHPDYVMSYAAPRGGVGFRHWSGDLLSFAIEDDGYAPERGVGALVGFYERARGETRLLRPADVGEKAIGHFGFFRPKFEPTLWKTARDWLVARAAT